MYSTICPECGDESSRHEHYCPQCGTEKEEILAHTNFAGSLTNSIAKKISFLDKPELYVQLFLRTLLLILGIVLIPGFIKKSEFFWICCTVYAITALFKKIDEQVPKLRGIYNVTRVLFSGYLGAGIGNLISFTGKGHNYTIGHFFDPEFLLENFLSNSLIFIGAISGICVMIILLVMIRQYNPGKR